MSIFLTILGGLAFLVVAFLLAALILPKQYAVTVRETINKPKQTVHTYIRLFQYQLQYSEWLKTDPTLQPYIEGTDGTVGSQLKWESNNPDKNKNVGSGEQEIIHMDENRIEVELRLLKPMPATCQLIHEFTAQETNVTIYTCTFSTSARFPVNLLAYLFGRGFIKKNNKRP